MNRAQEWYGELRKPVFAPPSWVFGPVWAVLYLIIACTFSFVAYQTAKGFLPLFVLAPFVCNLIANLAYSPIQFRLKNLILASADILIVLGSLVVALLSVYPYYPWVAFANIPYLLWVSFATVLQLTIMLMNKDQWSA